MGKILFHATSDDVDGIKIEQVLKSIGVGKGDTLFVHSRLFSLGKLGKGLAKKELTESIIGAFFNVIGSEGTLILPTFTFSFCKTGEFDSAKTPSETGVLGEVSRTFSSAIRTAHPIYSVVLFGRNTDYYKNASTTTCFGKGSIFDLIHKKEDVKILFLGLEFPGPSQFHYIEELLNVPYRHMKIFKGTSQGKEITVNFFVRNQPNQVEIDHHSFLDHCNQHGMLKQHHLGEGIVFLIKEKDFHDCFQKKMKQDSNYFLKVPYQHS